MRQRKPGNYAKPTFHSDFLRLISSKEGQAQWNGVGDLIMQLWDQGVTDGDTFITFGLNKSRKKVLVTVTEGEDKSIAAGVDLTEILIAMDGL